MKIVIVRHGQTRGNILNEQGISLFTGTLNNQDTDLTEKGIEDAKKLANNEIIKSIQKVYCSDLNRAIDTAKLAKPGYELNIDKRLRERSLGDFEGNYPEDLIKNEEYKKYFTDNEYKKFRTDFIQKAPNGENYTDIIKRTKIFLDSLNMEEDITIGIFSHMHCIRCLMYNLLKFTQKERIFNLKIKNCEPYVIERIEDGTFKLTSHNLNDLFSKVCW